MRMNPQTKASVVEDKDLENVELHRAESMVDQNAEILDQLKVSKVDHEKPSVVSYVGNITQSTFSGFPNIACELVMFLYMFSYIMRSITSTTMIMNKVCLVHLGYSEDVCENLQLKEYKEIKDEVEVMTNNYHLGHGLIQLMPSAFLALFIGPWSDKYGRKFFIIASLSGIIIDGFGTIICAYYFYSRVEYYFIPAIFSGFSGGFIGVMMVLYSYASDVTTAGKRTMKYAVMELSFGVSIPLGGLVGGWMFKYYKYVPVFLTSTCGHILGLCCVIFFLDETVGLDNKDDWMTKFRNFWSVERVVISFRTTAKKRPNRGREQIWLLILAMSVCVFGVASLAGIAYIYAHHQFDWENTTYSTVSAIYSIIGLGMMMIIVPLSKKWNVHDPVLGIMGSVSFMLKNIIIGIASKPWIYHLGSFAGLFSSLATLAGRSRISKLVPKEDLGKVFAFVTTAESILPIAASAVITQSFNATIKFFPGLMFVIVGVLMIIPIGVFIWIARLPIVSYEEMNEETHQSDVKPQGTGDASI